MALGGGGGVGLGGGMVSVAIGSSGVSDGAVMGMGVVAYRTIDGPQAMTASHRPITVTARIGLVIVASVVCFKIVLQQCSFLFMGRNLTIKPGITQIL